VPDDENDVPPPRGWPDGFGAGADRDALVRLSTIRGTLPRDVHRLAWREGSARACVRAILEGRAGTNGDRVWLASIDAADVLRATDEAGARFAGPGDDDYVDRLLDLSDPPAAIFVIGTAVPSQPSCVAIVGSRHASALGREVATGFARGLAGVGLCVVSGAARGIDEAAHVGALAAAGRTIAVLGAGIDHPYPRAGRGFLSRIVGAGGTLIAEYPPSVPPHARNFPARNRLIAAIASAVVVVEGVDKSGSRITADHALDLGRDVYAVPGPITSPLSATPHALIRDGATLARGLDDILDGLGVTARLATEPPPSLEGPDVAAWNALEVPALPDAVARRLGVSIPEAIEVLTGLELRGLIRSVGGRYERRFRVNVPAADGGEAADGVQSEATHEPARDAGRETGPGQAVDGAPDGIRTG
jgi:DNA processing protein